jgi:histidinol-phosphatase
VRNDILEFALSLARAAEAEIMPRFRTCTVNWKPDGSEVTDADRRAEEVMRELITKYSPTHAVLGEEYGGMRTSVSGPMWLLDPIDGTASFAVGLPTFGTLVAYIENGEPQAGVIHMPAMGETIYAARGSGCWARIADRDAVQVQVSGVSRLKQAYVSATSSSSVHMARLTSLMANARKFRFISDCIQYSLVAQGRIDAAMDPIVSPWDIAALVPCIEEAGGVITDLEGRRNDIVWQRSLLSSSSPELHAEIRSLLA